MVVGTIEKAVILARGLGTRMRQADDGADLNDRQAAVADTGVKGMIPTGRPFLDYLLAALLQADLSKVCLVIGPAHEQLREYYGNRLKSQRLQISFAVQDHPLGTADAVLAAEQFADGQEFVMINSDNYYPPQALRGLSKLNGPGLAAFERQSMFAGSNIPAERLRSFAVIKASADGHLQKIIEKPDAQALASLGEPVYVSMNCWRFGPGIFEACRAIEPSPRGELEIPDSVQYAIEKLGQRFTVVPIKAAVLDLSFRSDVAPVAKLLAEVEVNL